MLRDSLLSHATRLSVLGLLNDLWNFVCEWFYFGHKIERGEAIRLLAINGDLFARLPSSVRDLIHRSQKPMILAYHNPPKVWLSPEDQPVLSFENDQLVTFRRS